VLQKVGIEGVLADVFDAKRLIEVVRGFKPDVVIHQLTDLP